MTVTQEKILEAFKKHKTPKDGVLKPQSLNIHKWDRRSQDEFPSAMQELITEGYISTKDDWYVLTEKGYNNIYSDYSIEDTKTQILDVFRNHKTGVGQVLLPNHFIGLQQNADRFHFDNFNGAFQGLVSDGLIELTDAGHYKLTQKGYDKIY